MFQRCDDCKQPIFYPRPMCPHCWGTKLSWEKSAGEGKIEAFTIVHRAGVASLEAETPIALGEIVLKEGFRMIARIEYEDVGDVKSGRTVVILKGRRALRFTLPTFECI
jgi:uncharacterized OB-fold protein